MLSKELSSLSSLLSSRILISSKVWLSGAICPTTFYSTRFQIRQVLLYCFTDEAETLFPNAPSQNPVGIAAGDHPPENPAVVDDVDIDASENDDNYVDGRFALLYV